jgi:MEMO1 family protein
MTNISKQFSILLIIFVIYFNDTLLMKSQEPVDRYPAVAGQFYPADPDSLNKELKSLFAEAVQKRVENVRAIICPHAGYVFSGKTSASAFNQIDRDKKFKRIILIASSHQEYFEGAAIYCDGDYIMPYGKEKVDAVFGKMLVKDYPDIFTANQRPHLKEHSIEVQLPFLHYILKNEYCIVPIIIGGSNLATCQKIADALKPWFNKENLFIISSDFSHYPNYADAHKIDTETEESIVSNNPDILINTLKNHSTSGVHNLVTSLCGWTSVLTLQYITSCDTSMTYNPIVYSNSGDSPIYGEKNRVVGYWAIAVSEKSSNKDTFSLTESDKNNLLNLARKTLEEIVLNGKVSKPDTSGYSEILKANCGAFVTLHENGHLRGCIGHIVGTLPLYKTIQEMAVSSAKHDYRFLPVKSEELGKIDIEISVLSPLKKISDISEIELGKHGILIEKGNRSGVFLPQVATETGWTLDEFLGHCSRDKAGLSWDGWKTADLYIFSAIVFGEK